MHTLKIKIQKAHTAIDPLSDERSVHTHFYSLKKGLIGFMSLNNLMNSKKYIILYLEIAYIHGLLFRQEQIGSIFLKRVL